MATISKGNVLQKYVEFSTTVTITPGSGGSVRFDCSSPVGATRPDPQTIYAATEINVPGGSTVTAEAVGADATYTDGGEVTSLQALVSGDWIVDFSLTDAQRADVASGAATLDMSAAINAALQAYARSPGRARVRFPGGKYRIESQIVVPEHVILVGDGGDKFGPGEPGTEFAWYGPSGTTAVITSTGPDLDWSHGAIEHIRIQNYTAVGSGIGLGIRNPQNGAWIRNVTVKGFPTRQCLVYETAGRSSGAGTSPGFFFIDKSCFFVGGETPLEVQVGVEQIVVDGVGVDTDASSTRGVLVTKAAAGQPQRAPILFVGGKVEIQQASGDIDGVVWDQDLAIRFDSFAVQRNDNISSTKAAFRYTGTGRNIPTAQFDNCTSWNLANLFKFDAAGLAKPAAAVTTPQSFSWSRDMSDTAYMFGREALTAGLSAQSLNTANSSNLGGVGYVVPRDCYLAGISARHTSAISADTITLSVIKNGATFVSSLALNSANQGRVNDLMSGAAINSAAFQFAAGDRVSMQITTGAALAPVSGHCVAEAFLRPL